MFLFGLTVAAVAVFIFDEPERFGQVLRNIQTGFNSSSSEEVERHRSTRRANRRGLFARLFK